MNTSYKNPWIYNGEEINEVPSGVYGFVYCITNLLTDRKYIGRKYFWTKRKPRGAKRRVTKESDWRSYYGSCKDLKDDIETLGEECFFREILHLCETMGETNFIEVEEQFKRNVLRERDEFGNRVYYNGNIMSRYFVQPEKKSKEHCENISKGKKEYYKKYPITEERREQQRQIMKEWWGNVSEQKRQEISKSISESLTGKSNPKGSEALTGRDVSEETREKISKTLSGRKLSEETKKKMRGRTPWNKGVKGDDYIKIMNGNISPPPSCEGNIKITNGSENKWFPKDKEIPTGWYRGQSGQTTSKKIKLIYINGDYVVYESFKKLRDDNRMPLSTANRLLTRFDDEKFKNRRKTFLDVYKLEYID